MEAAATLGSSDLVTIAPSTLESIVPGIVPFSVE